MGDQIQKFFAAVFLMSVLAAPALASPMDDATAAYAQARNAEVLVRKAFQKVFDQMKPLAENGDPKAERMLGDMLYYGEAGAADQPAGVNWLAKAAELGNAAARLELADLGVVKLDAAEKQKLVRAAADQGDAQNQFAEGMDYDMGISGAKDEKEAFKWYLRAADQGHAMAQSMIGGMYMQGRGIAADNVQAYMWLSLTDAPFIPGQDLNTLAAKMKPEEVEKAKKLAKDWTPVMCRTTPGPCAYPKIQH